MLGSYAAIIIPAEKNIQENLLKVFKVILYLIRENYETYYSLKPFTIKVYERESNIRPYVRSFGPNTFIIKVYDKEELNHLLDEISGIRVNISYERFWVKGRRIIGTKVCIKNGSLILKNLLLEGGIEIDCENPNAYIMVIKDPTSFIAYSETITTCLKSIEKHYIGEIYITKPWNSIVYGLHLKDVIDDVRTKENEYIICKNSYFEELIMAYEKNAWFPIVSYSERPLIICVNNVFKSSSLSYVRLVMNTIFYALSYSVNVSV